jgi:DNA-binding NtrC family response regulator
MPHISSIESYLQKNRVSPYIARIFETIERIAISGLSVLIHGEIGTEKESLANMIHELSVRRNEKFISVDCHWLLPEITENKFFGAEKHYGGKIEIKPGIFENGIGGTIFLDNISTLSPSLLQKILNTVKKKNFKRICGIQQLEFDVRLITAIQVEKNHIKSENYLANNSLQYLCPLSVNLPPLRERHEDIMFFVNELIEKSNVSKSIKGISKETEEIFLKYYWPGNTVELQNIIKQSITVCQSQLIEISDIPSYIIEKISSGKNMFSRDNLILSSISGREN